MQKIIAHIEETVRTIEPFERETFLSRLDIGSHVTWMVHFPVAVAHSEDKMLPSDAAVFKKVGAIRDNGFTQTCYERKLLDMLSEEAPNALKRVAALCVTQANECYCYEPKRDGDKWKKVVDDGNFQAVVEVGVYETETDICRIETDLRNLMRSSKEVPSLKAIGFVWVVSVPASQEIRELLVHYFGECFLEVEKERTRLYIGWSDMLGNVNMRHFVCPPAKDRK